MNTGHAHGLHSRVKKCGEITSTKTAPLAQDRQEVVHWGDSRLFPLFEVGQTQLSGEATLTEQHSCTAPHAEDGQASRDSKLVRRRQADL